MIFTAPRTFPLKHPNRAMREMLYAMGLQAKNITHRAIFFIRNVFAAFDEKGNLRTDKMHENIILALDVAEKHIKLINA